MPRLQRCSRPSRRTAWKLLVIGVAVGLATATRAAAHEGPPFPILMDETAGPYVVSVWADPDIGEATFYIVVESPEGGPPDDSPEVSLWAEPVNGRLDRATYATHPRHLRNQLQFEAQPYFDQRDFWTVGFRITPPGGRAEEITTEVESTPPGYGIWDLAVYLFPFLLLGGLWIVAMVRRYRAVPPPCRMAANDGDGDSAPVPTKPSENTVQSNFAAAREQSGE